MANSTYDFLFRPERGRLELYDPACHGRWHIVERDDGRLAVGQVETQDTDNGEAGEAATGAAFAAEAHLRDYLVQHLEHLEPGLQLFVDEDGNDGVEYRTPIGRMDILAVDRNGGFVVIELKVSRGPDAVVGQVLRYKNWVRQHLAHGKRVRGIIIAQQISDKICYAIASDPDISAKQYELSLRLSDVSDAWHDSAKNRGRSKFP